MRGRPVPVHTPPSGAPSSGSLYLRALRLQPDGSADGTVVSTCEQYTSGTPVFPIYGSTDNGTSWRKLTGIADTQNG
ncbi:hypothetical protein [Streptomyces sp. NBC_00285]|uniref:hypothetical protein n=1 Tax=Streptomyces sp. NBC_00285 TaxID=2975700 RepID=UPI002E2D34A4|nr:hypothetical protein [Streptomyces sp. NBC_00285]